VFELAHTPSPETVPIGDLEKSTGLRTNHKRAATSCRNGWGRLPVPRLTRPTAPGRTLDEEPHERNRAGGKGGAARAHCIQEERLYKVQADIDDVCHDVARSGPFSSTTFIVLGRKPIVGSRLFACLISWHRPRRAGRRARSVVALLVSRDQVSGLRPFGP
jgi:hypothetical protein